MEKNALYWEAHKEEYQKAFDELHEESKEAIKADPRGAEAHALNIVVDRAIYSRMKKK